LGTPHHEQRLAAMVVIGTDYTGSCKSNSHTIPNHDGCKWDIRQSTWV